MLIKLCDAARLMRLLRFQSSCSPLWGANPVLFLVLWLHPPPSPRSPLYRPGESPLSPAPSPDYTNAEKVIYDSQSHSPLKCCLLCEAIFLKCLFFFHKEGHFEQETKSLTYPPIFGAVSSVEKLHECLLQCFSVDIFRHWSPIYCAVLSAVNASQASLHLLEVYFQNPN